MENKKILDPCCGSRMFWYNKDNPLAVYSDIREESHVLCDGRVLEVKPDIIADFRNLPFNNNSFKLVVFDPPHLDKLGKSSWMAKKYGVLSYTWRDDIKQGFNECMRVLDDYGVLVFKWNEMQIKTSEILKIVEQAPLFGHKSGKGYTTHWLTFMKIPNN